MATKCFFHICAKNAHSRHIVHEMTIAILFSGLYDAADSIYCYMSGTEEWMSLVKTDILTYGSKFKLMAYVPGDTSYERLTLEDIHNHIQDDDRILYIHSKGVNHSPDFQCVTDWRTYMLYELIRYHPKWTSLLTDNSYDVIGCNYRSEPLPHFSGNFFWIRGAYYKTLPRKIGHDYLDPEIRFSCSQNPRVLNVHESFVNHYHNLFPPSNYVDITK